MNTAPLLHNMSVLPKAIISYEPGPAQHVSRCIVFERPPDAAGLDAKGLLGLLNGRPARVSLKRAKANLRNLLNDHSRSLPWPPVVLIADPRGPCDSQCAELLTVLTVFSKSSGYVYQRDREPDLTFLDWERVILRFRIQEQQK